MSKHQPTTKTNNKPRKYVKAYNDLNTEQKELVSLLNGRKELDGKELTIYQEVLYAALYLMSREYTEFKEITGGWFMMKNDDLQKLTGIPSKSQLATCITRLEDLNLIERKQGSNKEKVPSVYRICTDKICTNKSVQIDFEKCTNEERFNFLKKRKLQKSVQIENEKCTNKSVQIENEGKSVQIENEDNSLKELSLYEKCTNRNDPSENKKCTKDKDKDKEKDKEWIIIIRELRKRVDELEKKVKELEEANETRTSWNGVVDFDKLFSSDKEEEAHQDQATQMNGMNEPLSNEVYGIVSPDGAKINKPQTEVEKDNASHEQETTHTSSKRLSIEDYISTDNSNEDVMNLLFPSDDNEPQEPSEKVQSNSKGTDLQGNIPSKTKNKPIQPTEHKTSVTTHTSTKEAQNNQKSTLTMKTTNPTPANILEWLESNTPGTSDERYLYLSKVFQALREPHTKQEHDLILSQARKGYINEGKYQEFLSKNPYREHPTTPQGNDDYKNLFAAAKEAYQAIQTCKTDELKTKMVEAKKAVNSLETIYTNKEKWQTYKDEMYSKIDAAFRKRSENDRLDNVQAAYHQAYMKDIEQAGSFMTAFHTIGNIFTPSNCKRTSAQTIHDDCKQAVEKNTNLSDDDKQKLYADLTVRMSIGNNNQ